MRALSNTRYTEQASFVDHIHHIDGYLFMAGANPGFEVRGAPALDMGFFFRVKKKYSNEDFCDISSRDYTFKE